MILPDRYTLALTMVCFLSGYRVYAQAESDLVCSLRLKIVDKDAKPTGNVLVELIGADGKVALSQYAKNGEVEICDFGFGKFSVRVAPGECLPTSVSGIRFKPGFPLRLTMVVNRCPLTYDHSSGCEAYLRVVDIGGKPVPGASVWQEKRDWKVQGDRFGRIVFPVGVGAPTIVTVGAAGFKPQPVALQCPEVKNIEKQVILEPEERH